MRVGRVTVAGLLAVLVCAGSAQAAFAPAKNGRILFELDVNAQASDVFFVNANGSGLTNLTNTADPVRELDPAISPNGRQIATERCDGVSTCDVFVGPPGGVMVNVTNSPMADDYEMEFSPDGRKIAVSHDDGGPTGSVIALINPDGTGLTPLATPSPTQSDFEPTFSPDGRAIFFVRCPANNECHIWRMNVDGSGAVQVSADTGVPEEFEPAVSPDGKTLAFYRCNGDCHVWLRNLKTGAETMLDPTAFGDFDPKFSPDGKKIAFIPDSGPPTNNYELWSMNANGTGATPVHVPADSSDATDPEWEYVYKCGGRRATIVGDAGPDKIKGTKKSDVIVSNGGKDTVKGRGGNDRICGGKGKDKLVGGPGGKDRCFGGKGKDTANACEAGKP